MVNNILDPHPFQQKFFLVLSLNTLSISKYLRLSIFTFLLIYSSFCEASYALDLACTEVIAVEQAPHFADLTKDEFDMFVEKQRAGSVNNVKLRHFNFTSGLTGLRVNFVTNIGLSVGRERDSTSEVFLSENRKIILKEFSSLHKSLAMYDILVTRFFEENGLPVPKVIDYSTKIFKRHKAYEFDSSYILKEAWLGLNLYERKKFKGTNKVWLSSLERELKEKRLVYQKVFKENFEQWVKIQPEYDVYIEANEMRPRHHNGDLDRISNWLLSSDGWLLIDP